MKILNLYAGIGGNRKQRGFEIIEILLIAHGGNHNDTICVVEHKIKGVPSNDVTTQMKMEVSPTKGVQQ